MVKNFHQTRTYSGRSINVGQFFEVLTWLNWYHLSYRRKNLYKSFKLFYKISSKSGNENFTSSHRVYIDIDDIRKVSYHWILVPRDRTVMPLATFLNSDFRDCAGPKILKIIFYRYISAWGRRPLSQMNVWKQLKAYTIDVLHTITNTIVLFFCSMTIFSGNKNCWSESSGHFHILTQLSHKLWVITYSP